MSRKQTTIADLQDVLNETKGIEKRLAQFGYQIALVPIEAEVESNVPNKSGKPSQKTGIAKYWQECRAIAESEGITLQKARRLYAKRSESAPMPQTSKSQAHSATMKKAQKKYWRAVKKIAEEQGISNSEARKVFKERKDAA